MLFMLSLLSLTTIAPFLPIALGSSTYLGKRSVSQSELNDLILYTKYSSAVELLFSTGCPKPLNSTLVVQFTNELTQTQGFVTRDDARKEIIVAFAGSEQVEDAITDIDIPLVPFTSQGVPGTITNGVLIHQGFINAYNSVASAVIDAVSTQLVENPSYTLVTTGHSLGGALASIASISLKANFPNAPIRMFTFGQPRTGSPEYATLVENLIGVKNIFRAVHTSDGVPTILPQILGYRHHGTEYWNFEDPTEPGSVKICAGEEDPTCSDSIPSTGINLAHLVYFGQHMALDPSLCGF